MDSVVIKHCKGCSFDLPATHFRASNTRDGLRSKCKTCERGYDKARSESRKDYRKEHRNWGRHTEVVRDWRERNREKMRAHGAVRRALASGKLVRQPCERCGSTHKVEAHHDDYSKPLDIRWLCEEHHKQRHVELRLDATKYQQQYLRWEIPGVQDEDEPVAPF